jgi:hypothetical protein
MSKLFQSSFIFIIAASCSISSITNTNLRDLTSFEPEATIYALPQTRLVVNVIAEKNVFIPGPYFKYADEFLGIKGASGDSGILWNIADIKLSTISEPDPEQFYSAKIKNYPSAIQNISELTNNGVLINPCTENNFQLSHNDFVSSVEEIPFSDLSVKSFFFDEKKKKQKNMLADSAFAMIPSLEKQLQTKSEKEKAFEAAQFIFKIRKRRFKLVSGQYEVFPEGIALQSAVKELNKLEKEYLSLFIGKKYSDTITNIFSVVPRNSEILQRFTLFRFSSQTGFFTSSENEGTPIIMEVKDLNQNELLNQLQMPVQKKGYLNYLYYRLPDNCSVSIFNDSHVLLESELPIFQLGAIVPNYSLIKIKK